MDYIKRVHDLREDHDSTQEYVARGLGTSQTMYAPYERGANELPIHHLLTIFWDSPTTRGPVDGRWVVVFLPAFTEMVQALPVAGSMNRQSHLCQPAAAL